MGTAQVEVLTASDIQQLQDDVSELTTKLNGLVIQYNKVSSDMTLNKDIIDDVLSEFSQVVADMGTNKNTINEAKATVNTIKSNMGTNKDMINQLKTDVEALRDKISGNYSQTVTSGGGSEDDSILKRLHDLDTDVVELDGLIANHMNVQTYWQELNVITSVNFGASSTTTGTVLCQVLSGTGYDNEFRHAQGSGGRSSSRGEGSGAAGSNPMIDIDEADETTVTGTALDSSVAVGGSGASDSSAVDGPALDTGINAAEAIGVEATYTTSPVSVISLTDTGARRAKKLVRKTLNTLRSKVR